MNKCEHSDFPCEKCWERAVLQDRADLIVLVKDIYKETKNNLRGGGLHPFTLDRIERTLENLKLTSEKV